LKKVPNELGINLDKSLAIFTQLTPETDNGLLLFETLRFSPNTPIEYPVPICENEKLKMEENEQL
jgi:hypothetical protein